MFRIFGKHCRTEAPRTPRSTHSEGEGPERITRCIAEGITRCNAAKTFALIDDVNCSTY